MKFVNRCVRLSSCWLSVILLVASLSATTEAGAACANIEEIFMDSIHIYFDADLGYAMELGLQYDTNSGTISGVTVTPPSGPLGPFSLDTEGGDRFEIFDGDTIDPEELTGMGYDLSSLRARYPDGTYTFTIDDADPGCPKDDVDVTYAFSLPNGTARNIYPGSDATINTGRPTAISVNTCTNCNCREASIESLDDNAVDLSWDPDVVLGLRPNVTRFEDYFGQNSGGNEGTGGDIEATGLPQGESYVIFTGVGVCGAANLSSCGGGDGSCDYYSGGFEIDLRLFDVSMSTATTATLSEVELGILELNSKGATVDVVTEEVGFYATIELEAQNFTDAILYIPNQEGSVSLTFDGFDEFYYQSALQATHADVLGIFPSTDGESKYVLMVDGGRASATLDFVPIQPDGVLTFTNLVDGATISSTPTFETNNACTDCTLAVVWLEDVATDGETIDTEADVFQPSSGPLTFISPDDFDGHSGALPYGDYIAGVEVLQEVVQDSELVATNAEASFNYYALDASIGVIQVTVPEPGMFSMQVVSLMGLALLARRRSQG